MFPGRNYDVSRELIDVARMGFNGFYTCVNMMFCVLADIILYIQISLQFYHVSRTN